MDHAIDRSPSDSFVGQGAVEASDAERCAQYPTWLHTYNHHRGHTGTQPLRSVPLAAVIPSSTRRDALAGGTSAQTAQQLRRPL